MFCLLPTEFSVNGVSGKPSQHYRISKLIHEYDSAVVAIGNTELRLNLIKGLCEIGYEVPTLIHEKAYVSPSAKIGIGFSITLQ